ncbi:MULTISPECIES: hypothetical protein [unclassified Duganella]|uniref:hypothetical protein n=1 Tax=unclassified Duganella TaxID=2636909 RepID=UPI000E34792A|nr:MULTISPECIES: hypothetical protein [unclassified Duganella]RFP08240.1 hypothetical protein D0T23_30050 [Duganella sp. BJB475]RFP22438.1 hypothetical protein D0T21_30725 [Duganella sp. BJB476]
MEIFAGRRAVGRWFKNFLALVGLLALLAGAARFLLGYFGDQPFQTKEMRSPDGRYKAVLLNESGGGGPSSYCIDTVVVIPADVKVDAREDAQVVYVGGCGSLRDPATNNLRNGPDVKWLASNRLEIRFPQESVGGVAAMRLKQYAVQGTVTITYRIDSSY